MTVSTTVIRVSYAGDGTSINFPITFPFYLATDLLVLLGGGVITTGYSVSGGAGTIGTLTMATAPATGVILQIILNPPQTQIVNLVDGTAFPSATLDQVNDRAVQIAQRLQDQINRSMRAPDGDVSPLMLLPNAASRANQALMFDSNGNLTTGVPNTQNITTGLLAPFLGLQQTALEVAANVTPINYAKWASPWKDISRFVPDNLGTTDYSVQLAAAFAAERNIIIPEGSYLFGSAYGSSIILRQGMTVTGGGRGSLGNYTAVIKVTSSTITPFATANSLSGTGGVVLSNFAIVGPGAGVSSVPGVNFVTAFNGALEKLVITGFAKGWAMSQGISSNSSFLNSATDCIIASNLVNIAAGVNSNALTLRNVTFGGGGSQYGLQYYDSLGLSVYGGDAEGVSVCAIDLDQQIAPPIGGHLVSGFHCEGNPASGGDIRIGNTGTVVSVALVGIVFSPGTNNPYPVNALSCDGLKIDSCALLSGYAVGVVNIGSVRNLSIINSPGFFPGGSAAAGQTSYTTGARAVGHGNSPISLASGASIVTAGKRAERFTATAAITGLGLNNGTSPGQQFTLINESAFTLTMDVAGTSGVASGTNCVIAAQTHKTFYWDAGTSLWYSN